MSRPALSALVLAAGLGTRLRPLTRVRAKAAAPVAGVPLIARVLQSLASAGLRDVVVNLHHLPASITAIVGDGAAWRLRVRYSWENPVLGSAGGPRHALPLLDSDPFLIVNADTLTNLDPTEVARAHAATGARVTLAVIRNPAPDRYGGVMVAPDGRVQGFTRAGDGTDTFHFIGVQVVNHSVFAALDDGMPAESVNHVYRDLIANEPGAVRAAVVEATFRDIGTVADYLSTSLAIAATEGLGALPIGASRIAPDARLLRTAVWDDVLVGAGCALTDCVLTDGVVLPPGTVLAGHAVVPAWACAAEPGTIRVGEALGVPIPGLASARDAGAAAASSPSTSA